jgi:cell division septation protein DedD
MSPLAGPVERQNRVTIDLNALPAPASGRPEIAAVAVTADRQEDLPAAQAAAAGEDAPASTVMHDMTVNHVPETTVETPAQEAAQSDTAAPQAALQRPAAAADTASTKTPTAKAIPAITAPDTTGAWMVNLAACTRESTAKRMLEEFRDKGVTAELVNVTVNEQPMIRIRTGGYASFREASDWAALLEERLGLDGAWVSKR